MGMTTGSKKKWWIGAPLTAVILLLIAIFFIPSYLSTNSGKRLVISLVEKNTGGDLEIQTLSLGWFQNQEIKHLKFSDKSGSQISFEELNSDLSFWGLLMRKGSVGTTRIQSPKIHFSLKEPKKKGASEKLPKGKKKEKGAVWSDLSGRLVISNGAASIQNGMTIENLTLDLLMLHAYTIESLDLHGTTNQNGVLGSFNANVKKKKWFEITASINQFPVEGLDRIIALVNPGYQGLLLASIGDSVTATMSASEDGSIQFSLKSPRLFIDLAPQFTGNAFVFSQGGRIAWTIKPAIFNHFVLDTHLKSDAQSELLLDSATFPYKKKVDFASMAAAGSLSFSDGDFLVKKINESITLESLSATFSTKKLSDLFSIQFKSQLNYEGKRNSGFEGKAAVQDVLEKTRSFPAVDVNIDNFPLALLDSWENGSLAKYLGATLSGKAQKSNKAITLSGRTPLLQFSDMALVVTDRVQLSAPSSFSYLVQPALYESLSHPFSLEGTLKALSVPLKEDLLLFSETDFSLDIKAHQIDFKDLFSLGGTSLPSFAGTINGDSLEATHFKGNGQLNFLEKSLGESIFGMALPFDINGTLRAQEELVVSPLTATLNGRKFKGTIEAAIERGLFILKKEFEANVLLEPDQINPILSKESEYPLLSKPTPLQIKIKPSQIPLKKTDLESLSFKGKGTIETLSMINPSNRYPFDFQDIELEFDLDGKKKASRIHFEGNTIEENQSGGKVDLTLSSKGKVADLISNPEKINIALSNFSSQIADVFLKSRGQLPDMIGKTFDLKYAMSKSGNSQNIDLYINSPNLDLEGSFIAGKMLELRSPRKPLKIRWEISEKVYDAFRRWKSGQKPLTSNNPLFEIAGTGSLKAQVAALSIPLDEQRKMFPKPVFNMYASHFDASTRIDRLKLKDGKTGQITELKAFDFAVAKPDVGNTPLAFNFNGNISPDGKGRGGKVVGTGKIEDFLSQSGSLDFSHITTSIHAQIKNLPSIFIDALSKLDTSSNFPPSAFLGDLFNADFDAQVKKSQGKVTMDINATACKASFSGIISDGILYLNEPLKALFTVTPRLNDVLHKGADLIVVSMEKPITLSIHDAGFSVPLKNLHIRDMSFKQGLLDLGQITVKDVGNAGRVSTLFKMNSGGDISLWFAPCDFSMQGGKMYVDRTEILYNRAYQVCLWGKVKFPSRKVDMTLGLTAQALNAALGIQGLDHDYVLKVPVRGSFGNIKVDSGAVAGKIAFLVAQKHLAPQTGIFGQVLGAVGKLTDDQSDVPPPKPPFPWQAKES